LKDKTQFGLLICALVALIVCGCRDTSPELQEMRGETMGTPISVEVCGVA
jgi:thiamine biosynthesis lipoprotein ApbE